MPEVTQEELEKLRKVQAREAGRQIQRDAQKVVLKKYAREVEAEIAKMGG